MVSWISAVAKRIHTAFREGKYLHDPHATIRQVERSITNEEVEAAVGKDVPEIIKLHPDYRQGPAVLIRGEAGKRILHVFCTIEQPILLITCYEPDTKIWYPGFRKRKR